MLYSHPHLANGGWAVQPPRLASPLFALAAALVLGVAAVAAASDSYAGARFHPFTLVRNGGCVPDAQHAGYGDCDPINLLFPGRTVDQARALLQAHGWQLGLGSTQWLHFDNARKVYQQDVHLVVYDSPTTQYHVRLWQVRGARTTLTLGAVHHEMRSGFSHVINMDWDEAEAYVRGQLCGTEAACGIAELATQASMQAAQGTPGAWRGWANDATATVVR